MAVSSQSNLKKYYPWFIGGGVVLVLGALAAATLLYVLLLRGNVAVTDLTLSQDSVTLGENLSATITLENRGMLNGKYHMVLLVDGQEKAEQDVTLKGRETRDINLDLKDLPAGSHQVSTEEMQRDLRILTPAAFEVLSLTADPSVINLGLCPVLTATVRNTGETAGDYTANVTMDGSALRAETVRIEPGATEELHIPVLFPDPGTHNARLENSSTTLQVLRPASIAATELTAPKYMPVGKDAQVAVTLSNAGDVAGTYTIKLQVNGKEQQTKEVTVQGQQTVEITMTVQLPKTGKYEIKAGEAKALTMYAVQIGRPNNGTLLVKKANGGSGRLTLVNNYDQDAIFILASDKDPKTPLLSVFVRAKSKAANIRVKDGNYVVYYTQGNDFDTASRKFTAKAFYFQFKDKIDFKTSRSSDYYYTYTNYSTWTITLNPGKEGNAPTDYVTEAQFPN